MKKLLQFLILIVCLVFGAFLAVMLSIPPRVPKEVTPQEFSVEKEIEHIRAFAQKPHAVGMQEHDNVRDYIFNELSELGLNPEIQKTRAFQKWRRGIYGTVEVENIVARLEGTNNSKAILLMAHYDSVPQGPGANDDGAGVAAILEMLRALKEGNPLKNDVIVLISDAEEMGLFGAKAFHDEHPWVKDIGVVLNLEARGWKGITIMFETGIEGGWTVEALKKAAPYPIGNSATNAIYQQMPNDTDFTIFKDAKLPGLNFSYIDHWYVYHQPIDDREHLDERTLYHHGSTVFAVTKYLGNMDFNDYKKGNIIYFNIARSIMISYPEKLVWIITILVILLMIATIIRAFRNKLITIKGVILGFVGFAVNSGIAIGLSALLIKLLTFRYKTDLEFLGAYPDFRSTYLLGFAFITIAAFTILYYIYKKWASIHALSIGALLWWLIGLILISIYVPGASYILTWPLLFSILGLWIVLKTNNSEDLPIWRVALIGLFSIPVMIIATQIYYTIIIAFSITFWSFGMLGFLLGLLVHQLVIFSKKGMWRFAIVMVIIGIGIVVFGFITISSEEKLISTRIIYKLDLDENESFLSVSSLDKWTSQFMKNPKPGDWDYKSKAPIAAKKAYNLEIIEDMKKNDKRTLKLKITPPQEISVAYFTATSKMPIAFSEIAGKPIDKEDKLLKKQEEYRVHLRAIALPEEGVELILTCEGMNPIEFDTWTIYQGLPKELNIPQPPKNIMPIAFTYVIKSYSF